MQAATKDIYRGAAFSELKGSGAPDARAASDDCDSIMAETKL
jgi:hypothetical protein